MHRPSEALDGKYLSSFLRTCLSCIFSQVVAYGKAIEFQYTQHISTNAVGLLIYVRIHIVSDTPYISRASLSRSSEGMGMILLHLTTPHVT